MKQTVLLLALCAGLSSAHAQSSVHELLVENKPEPVGLGTAQPRFSWEIQNKQRNTLQTAYEIKVTNGKNTVWNSGKVAADSSVHVAYKGNPLLSNERYQWQVRVWDNHGKNSAWSTPASFQMGLLNQSDWKAKWIESGIAEDPEYRPSQLFRKTFNTSKK
ncbi:glycoside hydrolase family 78 protein [Niabella ginsengisoli]|uniref:Alpha-L-rhamnosidase n=1 Tax=Niabella ginsengisoli TaxID=522298 RepID=A0ABS9SMC3_9BACT|nr:hypothetical protein [Niabella ginsengisoli]MCH5599534.1 hypothetical protein [Niabella ginsengisoli]